MNERSADDVETQLPDLSEVTLDELGRRPAFTAATALLLDRVADPSVSDNTRDTQSGAPC